MADHVSQDSDFLGKLARLLASDVQTLQHLFDSFICSVEHSWLHRFFWRLPFQGHIVRLVFVLRRLNGIAFGVFIVALIAGDKLLPCTDKPAFIVSLERLGNVVFVNLSIIISF